MLHVMYFAFYHKNRVIPTQKKSGEYAPSADMLPPVRVSPHFKYTYHHHISEIKQLFDT